MTTTKHFEELGELYVSTLQANAYWRGAAGTISDAVILAAGVNSDLTFTGLDLISAAANGLPRQTKAQAETETKSSTSNTITATGAGTSIADGSDGRGMGTAEREGVMTNGVFNGAAEAPPLAAAESLGVLSGGPDSVATAGGGGTAGFTLDQR
jgi:hypothetical protein